MAATRGILTPENKSGPKPSVSRLGHAGMVARADTYRTFTRAYVAADGSGYVVVWRDGQELHHFDFGAEEGGQV